MGPAGLRLSSSHNPVIIAFAVFRKALDLSRRNLLCRKADGKSQRLFLVVCGTQLLNVSGPLKYVLTLYFRIFRMAAKKKTEKKAAKPAESKRKY